MDLGRQYSPKQLAAITAGGALLFISTAAFAEWRAWSTHHHFMDGLDVGWGGWFFRFVVAVLILFPGIVISQVALSQLREGVRMDWWSEREIDALRTSVGLPAWTVLGCLLLAFFFLLMMFSRAPGLISFTTIYFLLPFNTISSLRMAVRKPIGREHKLMDWSAMKPMVSDHWGERAG